MNAISYCLFGSAPIYLQGALKNVELARTIYPGWKVVIYCAESVPKAVWMKLGKAGAEVRGPVEGVFNEMFWRFCVADDAQFERFIIRDCDSRLSRREALAVQEWIDSGLNWHSMRDHPHHWLPMGGGLFGGKTGLVKPSMKEAIIASKLAQRPYKREDGYSLDQTFLSHHVWPWAKASCLQHDSCNRTSYPEAKAFPTGMDGDRFVGEVVDERETPHPLHWQMRCNWKYA